MNTTGHAALRYTGLRLGIFAVCCLAVAVLAYIGVLPEGIGASNPLWIAALSILVSAPVSFVLLRRQREEMGRQIAQGVDRAKGKLQQNRSMEDDAVDAAGTTEAGRTATPATPAAPAASAAPGDETH